jgi:putative glycosyltransferase (TIGR04348 family)
MKHLTIVTPARPGARNGNLHTAARWAAMLRSAGCTVKVLQAWNGAPTDALVALHARRSHDSVQRWREAHPDAPLVVVLTGTDLYRDLPGSAPARRSLALADRVIVLQEAALQSLAAPVRRKARVVYQSSDTSLRHAPPRGGPFRIAIVGHLRDEKDPFCTVRSLAHLGDLDVEIVQIGGALDASHARQARGWMRREPRYRWLESVPHPRALRWIAQSHLLVVSSRMEGGANVIAEAARIGTPVLASRVPGNVGMLGARYPGYFPLGNEARLAKLIVRANAEGNFYKALRTALALRRSLFAPARERASLLSALGLAA